MANITKLSFGGSSYNIEDSATKTIAEALKTRMDSTDKSADLATASKDGFMSAADKTKLDGVETGANKYVLPTASASDLGGVKVAASSSIAVDAAGVISVVDNGHAHEIDNVTGLQAALDGKLSTALKGAANGLAELGADGKVPTAQLPSYVSDIVEGYLYNDKFYKDSAHTQEITPEANKIYVDLPSNKTYRWSGSAYVEISASLALGETESTAYRGDRGKAAYDHSQLADGTNPHATTFANIIDNIATTSRLGGVVVGSNLAVTADGVLSGNYSNATTSAAGLMSDTDKTKLDGVEEGANKFVLEAATTSALGGIKVGTNLAITADGVLSGNYANATTSAAGLMSDSDKVKLDGIEAGANKYVLPKATVTTLGGIVVGDNLTIDSDGKLSTTFTFYQTDGRLDLGNVTLA